MHCYTSQTTCRFHIHHHSLCFREWAVWTQRPWNLGRVVRPFMGVRLLARAGSVCVCVCERERPNRACKHRLGGLGGRCAVRFWLLRKNSWNFGASSNVLLQRVWTEWLELSSDRWGSQKVGHPKRAGSLLTSEMQHAFRVA